MARPEMEIFRISPEEGKCYEHIEATRSQYMRGMANRRYFSTNQPRYVGKFIREERSGYGDSGQVWAIFNDSGTENRVKYSYEGNTCFIEAPCKGSQGGKRTRKSRKNKKTRKYRK
jgi:hypothetical protein